MYPTKTKKDADTDYSQNVVTKFHKTAVHYSVSDEKKKEIRVPRKKCEEYFYID